MPHHVLYFLAVKSFVFATAILVCGALWSPTGDGSLIFVSITLTSLGIVAGVCGNMSKVATGRIADLERRLAALEPVQGN